MGVLSEGRTRWGLAALLGCVALLALALSFTLAVTPLTAEAQAVDGTGQIAGTVTKAEGGEGLKGIEACAFVASGGLEEPAGKHCTTTGEDGDYTVSELPSGEYYVEFAVPLGSLLDYITQYYKDKSSFSEAEPVSVGTVITPEIDAELQEGGRIEGTVTELAESKLPLQSIEVVAYETSGNKLPVDHTKTNEHGEYAIVGLAQGDYKVEFSPTPESGLNFVTQYYNNKTSLAHANEVEITKGKTAGEINAELQVGGAISGTVTDAWTHAQLSNILVVAIGSGETFAGVANTNASGEYSIVGLASGVYKIEFIGLGGGSPYILQYYNDQPSLASSNPVTANQGSTTPGIDAALVRKEPVDTAAPVISGTPAVGQTLSCSTGTWTGEPAPTYTYAWLRGGVAIPGASASTYAVQSADQGTDLACKVTATNKSGSAGAVSNAVSVPAAPPAPAPIPEVKLLSAKILVSRGSARVSIACAKATCRGTVELTEQILVRRHHHGRTRSRRETVVLARGSYALTAGQSATIRVRLTRAGRNALARAGHHRLPVTARVSLTGGTAIRGSVVLSEPMHRRRRR